MPRLTVSVLGQNRVDAQLLSDPTARPQDHTLIVHLTSRFHFVSHSFCQAVEGDLLERHQKDELELWRGGWRKAEHEQRLRGGIVPKVLQ